MRITNRSCKLSNRWREYTGQYIPQHNTFGSLIIRIVVRYLFEGKGGLLARDRVVSLLWVQWTTCSEFTRRLRPEYEGDWGDDLGVHIKVYKPPS